MKFKKVIPKNPWTTEQTEHRIALVKDELKDLHKPINKINSQIANLIETRLAYQRKISDKKKYLNQLEAQLKEQTTANTQNS